MASAVYRKLGDSRPQWPVPNRLNNHESELMNLPGSYIPEVAKKACQHVVACT